MEESRPKTDPPPTVLSMVKKFHDEGLYWDVQLQVNTEVFKSQRSLLAGMSEYFHTMFCSNLKEANTHKDQPIILHEMDAEVFKNIFHFMYTGDIVITDTNVYQLLLMSDFLRLRTADLEERCVKHVKQCCEDDDEPLPDALELFAFACMKGKETLVDNLNAHLCQHLRHYSNDAKFLEISFEYLNVLLKYSKNYLVALPSTSNLVLKIIFKWINYSREKRNQYRGELMRNIDFSNVASDYVLLLINTLQDFADQVTELPRNIKRSRSKLQIEMFNMEMITDRHDDGDTRSEGTITFKVENLSQVDSMDELFSETCVISNMSWNIRFDRDYDDIDICLQCLGTSKASKWSCYINAVVTIVSQQEEVRNLVCEPVSYIKFSSEDPIFFFNALLYKDLSRIEWNDLTRQENGFIKDDSITIQAHLMVDVPFKEKL